MESFGQVFAKYTSEYKVLLWNYPGQNYTIFNEGDVLNNEFLANCLDYLLGIVEDYNFNIFSPHGIKIVAFGSGLSIFLYWYKL